MFLELFNVWQGVQKYLEWLLIQQKEYQLEAVFEDDHSFRNIEICVFVADAFTYDNRRYLEDVFCFYE